MGEGVLGVGGGESAMGQDDGEGRRRRDGGWGQKAPLRREWDGACAKRRRPS